MNYSKKNNNNYTINCNCITIIHEREKKSTVRLNLRSSQCELLSRKASQRKNNLQDEQILPEIYINLEFCIHTFENIDEMDKFLEKHKLQHYHSERNRNVNSLTDIKEV